MNLRVHRLMILGVAVAVVAIVITAVARPRQSRAKVKSLSLEPSGLYDQAGAELPFVTLRLSIPELDGWEVEFCRDPFQVDCKIRGRWVKIENRGSIWWSIPHEMSFLIWPGTEMCRLHFKCQREGLRWRLLRMIMPSGAVYHQFPSRFSQWVWLKSPLRFMLLCLQKQRITFRRPAHWTQMTAEIAIPPYAALVDKGPKGGSSKDSVSRNRDSDAVR